jgi:hypothetical protein
LHRQKAATHANGSNVNNNLSIRRPVFRSAAASIINWVESGITPQVPTGMNITPNGTSSVNMPNKFIAVSKPLHSGQMTSSSRNWSAWTAKIMPPCTGVSGSATSTAVHHPRTSMRRTSSGAKIAAVRVER